MPNHNSATRRNHVLRMLQDNGHVTVMDLSDRLGVSEVTIRKDLRELEELKLLVRTHGGALSMNHYVYDVPLEEKAKLNADEKRRIGLAAAELVEDNDSIILDSGTTTLQIAYNLRGRRNLTVATNSVHVAQAVLSLPDVELIMLGGVVRSSAQSVVGAYAEQMLLDHSFRRLFIAGDGLSPDFGLTTTNHLEAHVNRKMIESSQEVIAVVDASKFDKRGRCRICGLDSIHVIITDDRVPGRILTRLQDSGVRVIVA